MHAKKQYRKASNDIKLSDKLIENRHSQTNQTTRCRFLNPDSVQKAEAKNSDVESKPNRTGISDSMKTGLESLSDSDLSPVSAHNNSPRPRQIGVLFYTNGTNIHIDPGQQKSLLHEGWHALQKMQDRVKPTIKLDGGIQISENAFLEQEADVLRSKSVAPIQFIKQPQYPVSQPISDSRQLPLQVKMTAPRDAIQLSKKGKWWGSKIGSIVGTAAGAAAGYAYGTLSATTGAITGGISESITGYQQGGLRGALVEGIGGTVTGAFSGMSSGMFHGGMVGWTLGSALGEGVGDWLTGPDAPSPQVLGPIARNMRARLDKLRTVDPALDLAVLNNPNVASLEMPMHSNEIRLLNWMHDALGELNFNEVSKGAQVRIPFHQGLFNRLIALGAQKRQSSHYSGTLFASGFRQVVGEQYGTTGQFLPTVLFGKIQDREGGFHMYFQPEGNAFNPDTGWEEKLRHVKDAINYAIFGKQQGPHGTSRHTDKNPITDTYYQRTIPDLTYLRAMDFKAFVANLVYTCSGSKLLSKVGVKSHEGQAISIEILTKLGLYGMAYMIWKKFVG